MASNFAPEAPKGCVLCRFSRRSRICRRNRPAGAPKALLGGIRGGGARPGSPALRKYRAIRRVCLLGPWPQIGARSLNCPEPPPGHLGHARALARQAPRIARSTDWRIADWSARF
eukprot:9838198-Alexandrium_andersonii.AAC.1